MTEQPTKLVHLVGLEFEGEMSIGKTRGNVYINHVVTCDCISCVLNSSFVLFSMYHVQIVLREEAFVEK